MCCKECPEYERCDEDGCLKDKCCPKCPEYYDCLGRDFIEEDSSYEDYQD